LVFCLLLLPPQLVGRDALVLLPAQLQVPLLRLLKPLLPLLLERPALRLDLLREAGELLAAALGALLLVVEVLLPPGC